MNNTKLSQRCLFEMFSILTFPLDAPHSSALCSQSIEKLPDLQNSIGELLVTFDKKVIEDFLADFNLLLFDSQPSKNHYHNNFQCLRYCVYFLKLISLYWRKINLIGKPRGLRGWQNLSYFNQNAFASFRFCHWIPTLHLFVINRFLVGGEEEREH